MPRGSEGSLLSRSQVWLAVLGVLVVQLGCIFWLGERRPIQPRPTEAAPRLQLAGEKSSELLQLLDPTLFALPHEKGFSGAGWLIPQAQEIQPFAWSEPPRWLSSPVAQLGGALSQFIGANRFEPLPAPVRPEPALFLPQLSSARPFPERSSAEVEGNLAKRRLLANLDLPSWPHTDLVSNSVVQLVVDAEGFPFSVTLLARSGLDVADKHALKEARRARFEALGNNSSAVGDLDWGTLTFSWHTVPAPPDTNPSARTP